jgi:hypothetical protein
VTVPGFSLVSPSLVSPTVPGFSGLQQGQEGRTSLTSRCLRGGSCGHLSLSHDPVADGVLGTGSEASGAAEAVGGEGLCGDAPGGGLQGTGTDAGSALCATLSVDSDSEEADAFQEPAEQAEGADELAEGAVGAKGEHQRYADGDADGSGLDVEVEEVEGVYEVVDDESSLAADDAEEQKEMQ